MNTSKVVAVFIFAIVLYKASSWDGRFRKLQEKETLSEEVKNYTNSKVILDIGGKKFATSKATLLRYENSLFSNLSANDWPTEADGSIFIDRNPKYFDVILDFLRNDLLDVDGWEKKEREKLEREFVFYNLPFPGVDISFATGKTALMEHWHQVNKGTLLKRGSHTWTVRIDNAEGGTDIGVVSPSHTGSFASSDGAKGSRTAWGLRNYGKVVNHGEKSFPGFKSGDIIKFELDLEKGILQYTINNSKLDSKNTDVKPPVHVAFSGPINSKATIIS